MKIDTYFIKKSIIKWYDSNKRDLPWRYKKTKKRNYVYRVLVSEFMLQQTTVNAVIPKFKDFTLRWPNIRKLVMLRTLIF